MFPSVLFYRRPSPALAGNGVKTWTGKFRFEFMLHDDFEPRTKGIPDRIKLERCVKDELMWPVRLKDFMNYLRFDEHSSENLKFYLWYMDYLGRWERLSEEEKAKSPEYTKDMWKEKAKMGPDVTITEVGDAENCLSNGETDHQPFRAEVQRIASIFLLPNSALELNLTNWERENTLTSLSKTTHPSAFMPVLQAVEYTLRVQSYPNFIGRQLSLGKRNRPRTIVAFWISFFGFLIALIGAILLILSPVSKLYRMIPGFFFFYATLAYFSGYRGICALLFIQRATLIDPWDDPEEFATKRHKRSRSQSSVNNNQDAELRSKSYQIAAWPSGLETPDNTGTNSPDTKSGLQSSSTSAYEVYFDDFDVKKATERLDEWKTKKPFLSRAFHVSPRIMEYGIQKLHMIMFLQHAITSILAAIVFIGITMSFPRYGKIF